VADCTANTFEFEVSAHTGQERPFNHSMFRRSQPSPCPYSGRRALGISVALRFWSFIRFRYEKMKRLQLGSAMPIFRARLGLQHEAPSNCDGAGPAAASAGVTCPHANVLIGATNASSETIVTTIAVLTTGIDLRLRNTSYSSCSFTMP
jgi:hypothetical protein